MKILYPSLMSLALIGLSAGANAQQTSDLSTEVELGAIFTTGNTEDENIKYKVTMDWLRTNWD